MVVTLSRRVVNRGIVLVAALAVLNVCSNAHALLAALTYQPTVTGGSFVNPTSVMDYMSRVAVASDRMSFTVGGDYSVLADGTSSTVTVSIVTSILTEDIFGGSNGATFNVNTSLSGQFAYIASSPPGTVPTLTTFSATSDLMGFPGTASVALVSSPIISRALANEGESLSRRRLPRS